MSERDAFDEGMTDSEIMAAATAMHAEQNLVGLLLLNTALLVAIGSQTTRRHILDHPLRVVGLE